MKISLREEKSTKYNLIKESKMVICNSSGVIRLICGFEESSTFIIELSAEEVEKIKAE